MLFNSWQFIFVFLPLTLFGFFLIGSFGRPRFAVWWLLLASLAFYGWDDPYRLVPLILASIAFNFITGRSLARRQRKPILFVGITGNLLFLAYFKYASFLLDNFGLLTGLATPRLSIALPIGISFYTFTQIAFLVDTYRKQGREYELAKYGLFVTYFPHLIAGPIIHHKEVMPQFDRAANYFPQLACIAEGLSWFSIGLFNKVIIADSLPAHIEPAFKAAAQGDIVAFGDAWIGALGYGLQIYFDFSAYSSMAIGLALMMGIRFPNNFNSPYKAESVIEFWRRWHMTLSQFLRDYLYIPLGGNRHGRCPTTRKSDGHNDPGRSMARRNVEFCCLGRNSWRGIAGESSMARTRVGRRISLPRPLSLAITLIFAMFAWVPFRAETLRSTLLIWKSMLGVNGLNLPNDGGMAEGAILISVLLLIALFAPNTQQILSSARHETMGASHLKWRPSPQWALVLGCLFGVAISAMIGAPTVFLYFRF